MKLALQISSWITVVICALLLISSMFDGDSALFTGCIMFAIAPVLAIIYCHELSQKQ